MVYHVSHIYAYSNKKENNTQFVIHLKSYYMFRPYFRTSSGTVYKYIEQENNTIV